MSKEYQEQLEKKLLSPYAALSMNSKGRAYAINPCTLRTEFQRDRDRILHCKSFRRLKYKTQVFFSPERDHYRTRLTHTLEVAQIALTIARALRLNEDLAGAIALGHDLGHTPFGHGGERALDKLAPNGFKHHVQSLRIVESLESGSGLNLTFEVRDGILNHNAQGRPSTLEGQVVHLADRIAYINHDIDDAARGGVIDIADLPEEAVRLLGDSHGKRINAMILDIVQNSADTPQISMTKEVEEATCMLRTYLFEKVYYSEFALKQEEKAAHLLNSLYEYYMKNTDALPQQYTTGTPEQTQQAIIDYISGMTDRYAVHAFHELFVPKSWSE
jgi:dGTPase